MTAHLVLPALDQQRPATLSKAVLTDLLRGELGFDGLVVTDALVMEAISRHYGAGEAAVLALEAGADLVLMPADARAALAAISAAVASGRLSRQQLEASADRRRRALDRVSRQEHPMGNAPELLEPDTDLAQTLLELSLQRQGGRVGAATTGGTTGGINLIRLESCLQAPQAVPQLPAQQLPAFQGFRAVLLEPRSPSPWSDEPEAPLNLAALGEGPVLVQLFVRGNPFRGSSAASEPWAQAILQLQRSDRLASLVVYGSPYLWQSLQAVLDPRIPAAYSPGQMPQAQSLALQSLGFGDTEAGHGAGDGFTD
jgi:beta-glucosidase